MEYKEFGGRYVVRLESGEPVIETVTKFLAEQRIGFANVSAAGAVRRVRLGYWNPSSKEYQYKEFDEQLEVVSFQGNASLKEDKPFLHIHGVFGRSDYSVVGGHVKEAWVHPTFEVWLRTEDVPVRRSHDDTTGLDLLELSGAAR
jgi:predicted DNA-binding protein with PD1-like motif